jgi:hypothetical protein
LGNYAVSKSGFIVKDTETGHVLQVSYRDGVYEGAVTIPEQNEFLPLAPWKRGENPFQDDDSFEGEQTGISDDGSWWFAIRPSVPFSEILAEVEALAHGGLVKQTPKIARVKLADVAQKVAKTGYLFWDINEDLGVSCEEIVKGPAEIYMAYGYARRAAMTGLYLQGLIQRDGLDHVNAVFKSIQLNTNQTVEFQRQAFLDAIEYMQTYSPFITSLLIKTMAQMIGKYKPSSTRMKDADLFKTVIDVAHAKQEQLRDTP